MLIIRGVIAKHLTFENFFSKKEKQSIGTAWRKKFRAGFTGVPGTAIMRVGKKTACFSGIEYHLISEKIL